MPLRLSFPIRKMDRMVHNLYFCCTCVLYLSYIEIFLKDLAWWLPPHRPSMAIAIVRLSACVACALLKDTLTLIFINIPVAFLCIGSHFHFASSFDLSLLTESGPNCITGQNLYLESEPAARSKIYWCVREGSIDFLFLEIYFKNPEGSETLIEWWWRADMELL